MSTSSQLIRSRESLIDHIQSTLCKVGFERSGDRFEHRVMAQVGQAQVMVINGQCYEQPPQTIPVHLVCDCLGEGQVISEDGRSESFELINFEIIYPDHRVGCGYSVYYGEHEAFNKLAKQYFGL